MTREEAQARMYQLWEQRHRIESEKKFLDDQLEAIYTERRKIFSEFPTIDIYRRPK